MASAPFRATESGSSNTSSFMRLSHLWSGLSSNAEIFRLCGHRVVPPSGRRHSLVDLTRAPIAFLVYVGRSSGLQHRIHASVFLEAVVRSRPKPVQVPTAICNSDHRHIQMPAFHHRLQRRENLLVCEIARGAEEHQSVRVGIAHRNFLLELLAGGLFHVTTESEPHGGQYPVLVIRLAARGE